MNKQKPLYELNHEIISLLNKTFGAADTIRFIQQYTNGKGNYTEERKELYKNITADKLFAELESFQKNRG